MYVREESVWISCCRAVLA